MKVLVVEDDLRIRTELLDSLRAEGYDPEVAVSRSMAFDALRRHYDLVLLDVGLPDGDGLDLCRELRSQGRSVPVIVLSAHDRPEERVAGLNAGADDYVIKPFHVPEVVARVRNLLRRTGRSHEGGLQRHLDLWADLGSVAAGRGELRFKLKPREFYLLTFLISHPGRAWTRAELLDQVWGHDYSGDERTVDLHVRRLRAKIEPNPVEPRYIETVWGVGYRMTEQVGGSTPPAAATEESLGSGAE